MKVFLWACLDSNLNTHSGIAAGACRDSVLEDVKRKIAGVLYTTVHHLPDIFPVMNENGDVVGMGGVDMAKGHDWQAGPYNHIGEAAVGAPDAMGAPFDDPDKGVGR